MQAAVHQKKESHSNFCVCGRGGALFHTQLVGNSCPSPLVVLQFAYPTILHCLFFSCRLRYRTEAAGSSSSEEISENAGQGCCLSSGLTQSHSRGRSTVETKSSCSIGNLSRMLLDCERLLRDVEYISTKKDRGTV